MTTPNEIDVKDGARTMQFHHHGYISTNPRVSLPAGLGAERAADLPDEVDVLIVGSGPAGMLLAAQLAQFPTINTRIIERRSGRLPLGHADGIQARSVETFQAFGFAEQIIQEAYEITAMHFWASDPEHPENIVRTSCDPDLTPQFSEFPHLIVNQARVLDYFAEAAANAPGRITPDYGYEFITLTVDDGEYPVEVRVRHANGAFDKEEGTFIDLSPESDVAPSRGEGERIIRAKYVVGCDGARSAVRSSIGRVMAGDQAMHGWAVMDVLTETDFPDIRTKCAISSEAGSILLIPREGGYLCRLYVDLGDLTEASERTIRGTTIDEAIAQANRIVHPYTLEARHVAWYSVYEVAHRLTDKFDDVDGDSRTPRVFVTGDACHTHSAKAGQGMNVSMQDGFNLGWKLGAVLEGRAPASLLTTYHGERWQIAEDLINFDREWSSMMAKKPEDFDDPAELAEFYDRTFEFPTGFMTQYPPSMITGDQAHQALATGYPVGKRFRSELTDRVDDANHIHLGHHARADGRWRIYAFADADRTALDAWAAWLRGDPESPVVKYTPAGAELDAVFDVKVIFQQAYSDIDIMAVPEIFLPRSGPWQLRDYEKVYATHPDVDIFETRGIDRDGCVVVVRPDQYVAHVLPLTETGELAAFFARNMIAQ